jgi:hypothetical protein
MSDREKKVRLEGTVHAYHYDRNAGGKDFLGAFLECSDGAVWLIDYEEQSPFHAFSGRRVVVAGEPYTPGKGQRLFGWRGGKTTGHFRVSTMRSVEATADLEVVEVGEGFALPGRFERDTSDTGESMLRFVTQNGDVFAVANDPAGASVDRDVEVWAYLVQPSPLLQKSTWQSLWIICPYSMSDLWEWRGRREQ